MMKLKSVVFAGVLLASAVSNAQNIQQITPTQALSYLLGDNVQYSNVQYSGLASQLGYISNAGNPMQIASGMILSTADVQNNSPSGLGMDDLFAAGDYPDLLEIANSVPELIGQDFVVTDLNDIAIIEFDFVASGNELSFDYIFGSDEYLTYVNTQYNDVFAFLLSGPGITGPYDAPAGFPDGAINLAIVPGSAPELPITISSVNNVLNSGYYINNPSQQGIALNGITTTLTVNYPVSCGETYHISLVIADGSDGSLKSSVIFKENSFNTSASSITPIAFDPAQNFPSETTVEGCIPGQFVLTPPPCLIEDLTVNLVYEGTAVLGVDYESSLPATVTFTPETTEIIIDIDPLDDDEEEGLETIIVSFTYQALSGEMITVSGSLDLHDYDDNEPFINPIDDLYICPGTSESAAAVIQNGIAPYTYLWSNGQTTQTASFPSGSAGPAEVTITDYCEYTWTNYFDIIEPEPLRADLVTVCIGDPVIIASGGTLPYSYGVENPVVAMLNPETGVFTGMAYGVTPILVTDACGEQVTGSINVEFCDIPNVISPNGDGKNEFLKFPSIDRYPNSKLQVWNRWGVLVYENENYENRWSAEEQPDGTYYYVFLRSDGVVYSGELTVLR